MGKWILGVLGSIITGVVVYWLTVGMDNPQHPPNLTIATPIASAFKLNFFYRESAGGPSKPILPGSVLHSGDHYKIVFTPHRNGYIYLFQVDSHGQIFQLFPMTEFRGVRLSNTNPVQAGRQYTLPASDKSFRLDTTVGLERILLVFTDGPNEGLAFLTKTLTSTRSRNDVTAQLRANSALSSHLNNAFRYRGLAAVETDQILTSTWDDTRSFTALTRQLENFCDDCVYGIEFSHQ